MPTVDELNAMQLEIMGGHDWGWAGTKVPQTEENRVIWERLAAEIADMKARGITPVFASEIAI